MKKNGILAGLSAMLTAAVLAASPVLTAVAEGYPFNTTCTYYYDQFDSNARALYDGMLTACRIVDESDKTYTTVPEVPYSGLSYEQMSDLVVMFMYDHPEFFWLKNSYNYGYDWNGQYVMLNIYDAYQSGSARANARSEIIAIEQGYINGALQYATDYERSKYLSDALYRDITYASGDLDQSIASALLQKQTVCAGFTKAYSLLANAVGVDTVSFTGVGHGWNATKIADVWYHNDVTNDLFLYSDSQIAKFDTYAGTYTRTDSSGNVRHYRMHDLDYEYYTDIFPDTSLSYNGASYVISDSGLVTEVPTEPPTEPVTEPPTEPAGDTQLSYSADPVTCYYYAEDMREISPKDLISRLWQVEKTVSGNSTTTTRTSVADLAPLRLSANWESPAAIYASMNGGTPWFHGSLAAQYDGSPLTIGDVWIVPHGDFDGNGVANAGDAASILIYAASLGAGSGAVYPEGVDTEAALFAGKFASDSATTLSAADAAALLIYAAELGAG